MRRVEREGWTRYMEARNDGHSVIEACKRAGKTLSLSTAYRFERGDQASKGLDVAKELGIHTVAGKIIQHPLDPLALKALSDFAYFRLRYMGRRSQPWQERAAYDVLRYLETPDKELVVINAPPGGGKSTLFTHDIPAWLIARRRTIRIQLGSMTERQAAGYVNALKQTLESTIPIQADAEDLATGKAVDALACMSDDYGVFRPEGRSEIWTSREFKVRQADGRLSDHKEKTVAAYGQDSGILGYRSDLSVWDDLVDEKNTRGAEAREKLIAFWGRNAVRRLEPGGLLILQGQRIAHNDLYRYCLDQTNMDESPRYRHIVYQAHDDELCQGIHGPEAKPWPDGCLLDPHRIPWTGKDGLETIKKNEPRTYQVLYQQQDGDEVGGLVQPEWVKGGVDQDGFEAPGCLDLDRAMGVIPEHLTSGRGWSFVTIDPSVNMWWGIIWWVYDPDSENRYIIRIVRRKLSQTEFLTMDLDDQTFTGVLPDLWQEAQDLRTPIQAVVFEENAAQKWFRTMVSTQAWLNRTGVRLIGHTTHINKADPKYGLMSIGNLFRQGKIRIPWADPTTRHLADPLIKEAQRHPDSETTDLIMSTWFGKLAVENHYVPPERRQARFPRPSYLQHKQRGLASYSRGAPGWR